MKGKKYPVACKTKDSVMAAAKARKSGGAVNSAHKAKEIGVVGGGDSMKHAGKASRGVHGKPLMSEASGAGSRPGRK